MGHSVEEHALDQAIALQSEFLNWEIQYNIVVAVYFYNVLLTIYRVQKSTWKPSKP